VAQQRARQGDGGNPAGENSPTVARLFSAARAQSGHELMALARIIEPRYTWNDIVLPEDALTQLQEICQRVAFRHRVLGEWGFDRKLALGKGVTVLFAGPSGAGKTMAAEILANELGLDLYKIDLSGVVSKYIGETEKNLERIFVAAENANAILFFDEADALFGKRSEVSDAHDRYANIEISYLLQRMEEYDGIAILATNLRQNLDDAFIRRTAFTIHFPFPDAEHRLRIWARIWPPETPLAADVDLQFLAERCKLSGGNIKNVALAAAFLAAAEQRPVAMKHLQQAIRREYQKIGKVLDDTDLVSTR
jgi:SpoVK/Ycf46/Vps4 family AAA+-type ATPase